MSLILDALTFRNSPTSSLANPEGWLFEAFGMSLTDAGVSVSPQSSLQCVAVYACVNVLAQSIAQIPADVYRRSANGATKQVARDRREHWLLHNEVNDTQSSFQFRMAFMANMLLFGNGYAEIIRDGSARTVALRLLPAWTVQVYEDARNLKLVYNITRPWGEQVSLDGSDVLHVPCISFDGVAGLSPIAQHKQAIAMSQAAERMGAAFFGNAARPSGYLSADKPLKPDEREELEQKWASFYGGSSKTGKAPVLSGGLKWNQLSITPDEAQFLQTRQFQVEEIARMFRVPGVLVGIADKGSKSSSEDQFLSFVKFTLAPLAQAIEQEFNRKLFPGSDTLYCKLDLNGLLRGDAKARGEFYKNLWAVGALSSNEIRDWEDLDPAAGGDRYFVQQGFMPLDRVDDVIDKQGGAPAAQPKQGTNDKPAADNNRSTAVVAAHRTWLNDVVQRVSKWERRDAAKVADAIGPVFRSLAGGADVGAFCTEIANSFEASESFSEKALDAFLTRTAQ